MENNIKDVRTMSDLELGQVGILMHQELMRLQANISAINQEFANRANKSKEQLECKKEGSRS